MSADWMAGGDVIFRVVGFFYCIGVMTFLYGLAYLGYCVASWLLSLI